MRRGTIGPTKSHRKAMWRTMSGVIGATGETGVNQIGKLLNMCSMHNPLVFSTQQCRNIYSCTLLVAPDA